MPRRYRKQGTEEGGIWGLIEGLVGLYFAYIVLQYFANRANFWRLLVNSIVLFAVIFIAIFLFYRLKNKRKEKRTAKIIDTIRKVGLEEYIKNFITRFGLGQDKSKNVWQYRGYSIDWNRINDLQAFLQTKGISFTPPDINILLRRYINEREYGVTSDSIKVTSQNFTALSGSDFEKLLYRLYQAMGYSVQTTGRAGDQGGDLVANKGQERLLIQAKRYNYAVGNSAVQEAAAAKNHYDCNKATVIATNDFTREAIELAKTNDVELIPKKVLQQILLDYLGESWN